MPEFIPKFTSAEVKSLKNYIGEKKNGKPHGKGKKKFENGTYEGDFCNGKMSGLGKYLFPKGVYYEGNFKDNCFWGKGAILTNQKQKIIEGDFVKNRIIKGFRLYKNKEEYTGHFCDCCGRKAGKGKLKRPDGTFYEGEWQNGYANGYGIETYDGGIKYEGNFKKGLRDGKGLMTAPNGYYYKGDFVKGKFHGKGKLSSTENQEYEGDFIANKMNGYGVFSFKIPEEFDFGIKVKCYEGKFKNDIFDGRGTITDENGVTFSCEFEKGHIKEFQNNFVCETHEWKYEGQSNFITFQGRGKLEWPNGSYYEGEFYNNQMQGQGKIMYKDGCILESNFQNGNIEGDAVILSPEKKKIEASFCNGEIEEIFLL